MKSTEQLEFIMKTMIEFINTEKKIFENKEKFISFLRNNFDNWMLYTNAFIPVYNRHSSLKSFESLNGKNKNIKKESYKSKNINHPIPVNPGIFGTITTSTTIGANTITMSDLGIQEIDLPSENIDPIDF